MPVHNVQKTRFNLVVHDTHFHDTTDTSIRIRAGSSQLLDAQHCVIGFISIEQRDGLESVMKWRVYEKNQPALIKRRRWLVCKSPSVNMNARSNAFIASW